MPNRELQLALHRAKTLTGASKNRVHFALVLKGSTNGILLASPKKIAPQKFAEAKEKITDQVTQKVGWDTSEQSKSFAIDTLSRDLEDGQCIPHSAETFEELRTFVHGERGKMGGLPGKHDDRVMAISLANIGAKE